MAYLLIEDFAAGLDRRKSNITARPGSLYTLKNGYINAGGEIEKRFKLTTIASAISSSTVGLTHHQNGLYVFGVAASVVGLPTWLTYQQLVLAVPGPTISKILSATPFGVQLYVIARMSDDSLAHFLDGTQVTDSSVTGTYARAHKKKMFVADDENLWFSGVAAADVYDPTDVTNPGAGIIDMTQEDGSGGDVIALVPYYSFLAVLARTSVQIWAMDPDPDLSQQVQTLGDVGVLAHNAAARYANGDVLFLSDTGIRSIRARDSSNAAVENDIGSPIDSIIQAKRIADFTGPEDSITAMTDPLTGHWWLVWGSDVYVLSHYPNSKVSAWSQFDFGSVSIDYVARGSARVFFRAGNNLYAYGAVADLADPADPSGSLPALAGFYDDTEVEIITPFLDTGDPATEKSWQGFDAAGSGNWRVSVAPDIRQPTVFEDVGTFVDSTYQDGRVGLSQRSTHLAVKLVSTSVNARLDAIGLHYTTGRTD